MGPVYQFQKEEKDKISNGVEISYNKVVVKELVYKQIRYYCISRIKILVKEFHERFF